MSDPSGIPWFLVQLIGLAGAILAAAWVGCRAADGRAIRSATEGLEEELAAFERPVEALPRGDSDPEC